MELSFLRPLYAEGAPVASVYLDTTRAVPDADERIATRWRTARRTLAEQGADDATLDVLDATVGGVPDLPGPQGEALFAADGRLLGAFTLTEPPAADRALWAPVPDPLLLAFDRDHQVPHVVVAVDREGADVEGYPAAAHEPAFRRTFNGSTLHITRVRAGAEAQASFHRRTVNVWSENAEQAARDVRDAVDAVDAEVVMVAGDPKALGLLRDHLGPPAERLVKVGGGRTDAQSRAALREAAGAALHEISAESHRDALRQLESALDGGQALQGIPAVKEALAEGRVDTLYMAPPSDAPDVPLFASERNPRALATDRAALGDDPTVFEAPAPLLLLRAAVLGDASFSEILPPTRCTDGVAALLRY
ncbi:Vms1/Ankzf1 family peptidyl-tRNA hydrolase [Streptomyces sp. NPDC014733]|uniref:baeRF2 domain-containing protein n=1 Tax=Streptomyces sp. NPDC014733 TaxID=3364885 RepID=UPI0036F91FD9